MKTPISIFPFSSLRVGAIVPEDVPNPRIAARRNWNGWQIARKFCQWNAPKRATIQYVQYLFLDPTSLLKKKRQRALIFDNCSNTRMKFRIRRVNKHFSFEMEFIHIVKKADTLV